MEHILAIDPGREKNGVAILSRQGDVLYQGIVATENLMEQIVHLLDDYQIAFLVTGDGTGSESLRKMLDITGIPARVKGIITIDEKHSTEEGRKRYWIEHPPKGLKTLIPLGMQTPPRPIDDYVAVILAERYLQKY